MRLPRGRRIGQHGETSLRKDVRIVSSGPRPPRHPSDLLTATVIRSLRLGPRRNKITVDRGLRIPMRDGTILMGDHFAPVTGSRRPTILMRSPYGRGWQMQLMARPFAERGYHVLLQSSRGTFGSGGRFRPAADEARDGQDTVAWLRGQDWFNGRLAAVGASYLAFAAWALAVDPPPELFAMAVQISPHDLAAAGFGQGPFELYNLLMWSDLMAHQERHGSAVMLWRTMTSEKRLAPALNRLPLARTAATIGGDGAPWYADWIAHPNPADRYWAGYSAAQALERVAVPTLLITGFHDFFVEQTIGQYHALRGRGVQTGLTIGPWHHMTLDLGTAIRETVQWLDAFAGTDDSSSPRRAGTRVWQSGTRQWRELDQWPPPEARAREWYLHAGGSLTAEEPAGHGASTVRYDPADPTPSVGGRIMSMRRAGSRENAALEARPDVLTFSTPPLEQPVEVAGVPRVRLYLSSDNAHHDIFVRLCDVDERGASRNLTDQIVRSVPAEVPVGQVRSVTIALTDVSHVFLPGHRIRLQLAGGAHPRFARNLGVPLDLQHGTRTVPVTHQVRHEANHKSAIALPVVTSAPPPAEAKRAGRLAAEV